MIQSPCSPFPLNRQRHILQALINTNLPFLDFEDAQLLEAEHSDFWRLSWSWTNPGNPRHAAHLTYETNPDQPAEPHKWLAMHTDSSLDNLEVESWSTYTLRTLWPTQAPPAVRSLQAQFARLTLQHSLCLNTA